MKKYFEYMDNVRVSDTFHQRLGELEGPKKRTPAWRKYGAAAAALALVAGVGAYGLSQSGWDAIAANFHPLAAHTPMPENADATVPDIAVVTPGDDVESGTKTIGGYEIQEGEMTCRYLLPYIEYGDTGGAEVCVDWDVPPGSTKRDLTQADLAVLFGGEENLSVHLDWDSYELTGWAAWYEDGSFWGAYLYGYAGPLDHFEFAFTAGSLPPTCIVLPGSTSQDILGLAVVAEGYDSVAGPNGGVDASGRRVSFMRNGYGYRFDLIGVSRALTEERVSRLVRWIATEGLEANALSSDGAVLAHPWEADPGCGAGEPDYEDSISEYDNNCPYCVDGIPHTHPYDPLEAADPSYNAPN